MRNAPPSCASEPWPNLCPKPPLKISFTVFARTRGEKTSINVISLKAYFLNRTRSGSQTIGNRTSSSRRKTSPCAGVPEPTRTTETPAAFSRSSSQRKSVTCLRANGQPKWRRKTSATVPRFQKELSRVLVPSESVTVRSGAGWFTLSR